MVTNGVQPNPYDKLPKDFKELLEQLMEKGIDKK